MKRTKHLFAILYGFLLFAFTAYVLLDTFVIVRKYASAEDEEPAAQAIEVIPLTAETESDDTNAPASDAESVVSNTVELVQAQTSALSEAVETISTDTSYQDENISVQLAQYRISNTTVYVADVQLASAEFLKTAFADNTYGQNVRAKTSVTADQVQAILAINGDYYGAQKSGYVIRNGVLYRSAAKKNAEDLVIYQDGTFDIIRESDITAQELLDNGAWNVLSFGPALVEDGELSVTVSDEVGRAMASNPRTAIAVIDDLHYLFVVSDGRTSESDGLTLYELATFLKTLGAKTAYNLDGGGSSTMILNGNLINNPTSSGNRIKERSVSDIVYIG